jgi:pSer/pThr/pTyr-binding forkhead associated (FHA) protein
MPATIGRSGDNVIKLEAPYVSRHHAVIRYENDHFVLIDLGSDLPVQVQTKALEAGDPYILQQHDLIEIGEYSFRFQMAEASISSKPIENAATTVFDANALRNAMGASAVAEAPPFSARRFFGEQQAFIQDNNIEGLLKIYYQPDAVMLGPGYNVTGLAALNEKISQEMGGLKLKQVDNFTEAENTIFFEATYETPQGEISKFGAWVLRDGKIAYHFVGVKK